MIAEGSGLQMCLIVSGIVKVSDAGYMTDEAMSPLRRASMMATPLAAAPYRASGLVLWPEAAEYDVCSNVCCWGAKRTGYAHSEFFGFWPIATLPQQFMSAMPEKRTNPNRRE
jgi:hypothetical protein